MRRISTGSGRIAVYPERNLGEGESEVGTVRGVEAGEVEFSVGVCVDTTETSEDDRAPGPPSGLTEVHSGAVSSEPISNAVIVSNA